MLKKRYLECRVLGKHRTGCLVTLAGKLSGKHADPLSEVVTKLLEGKPCETITFDKGKEFARHQKTGNALWEPKSISPILTAPGSRNEGKHERTASAVLPQGKSMTQVSQKDVDAAIHLLNDRPRKCLGWKTPLEAFLEILHQDGQERVALDLTN